MRRSLAPTRVAAVAAGGVVGSGVRAAVALASPVGGSWPWATFGVNVVGAAVLGWFVARLRRVAGPPWALELWGIGLLGSFTTFSTFAVEVVALLRGGHPITGVLYGLTSVVVGVLAAGLGMQLGGAR